MKKFIITALASIIAFTFSAIVFASEPAPKAMSININKATEEQLKALPGIGDEYAKKIIAGRPYHENNELVSKKIITTDLFEKINKLIRSKC